MHRGDLKKHIQIQVSERSIAMPININKKNDLKLEKNYFPATMQGYFDNQHTFLLENKIYSHQVGYEILTPFKLNDGKKVILVNRGWVPQGKDRKQLPIIPTFSNQINLQGLIVFPNNTFSFKSPYETTWPKRIQTINPEFLKKNNFQAFIVVINTKSAYGFTPHWQPIVLSASRHYAYAFQWFGLSITLIIAFFLVHLHRL
ncbi:MAG: hypothetical protein RLY40_1318 [Pseudomonadota bacterium]|jgi:surfeit locus 1 family protein